MSRSETELRALAGDVRSNWQRFSDQFASVRPELYRYCRALTRSPWDAEDLVHDVLMRGFVTLGQIFGDLPAPRAWLFRVATNLWIDRRRHAHFEVLTPPPTEPATDPAEPQAVREAAGTLLVHLSPQERAAVVLKDVFDFSLEEVAHILSTTVGAVKAALSRGRGRLLVNDDTVTRQPAPGALDAFCAAFNARDLEGLTRLLLADATVEIVGLVTEYGRDAPKDPKTGSFAGTMSPLTTDERGGVGAAFLVGYRGGIPRCEVHAYRDSWLLAFWYDHNDGPKVRTFMTAAIAGDGIAHIRNYFFSPEVITEVAAELGLPCQINGYRYWPARP